MIDTRFWIAAKARLQFLEDAKIHQHELLDITFGRSSTTCLLSPDGFARLARQFGVKQVQFSQFGRDCPWFLHQGIRFNCVCSESDLQKFGKEFELVCVDGHLKEAGY